MIDVDPYLLVRSASVYIVSVATVAVWVWRRPQARAVSAAVMAFFLNLPALLVLHVAATRLGWWQFDVRGGVLVGMPVDLYLAWAWLWGGLPALALPSQPLAVVVLAGLAIDLVLMPAATPVVRVGPTWLVGEGVGLAICLVPAQLLARWTARDDHLVSRAVLQVATFAGLMLFVLPAIAIDGSGSAWLNPLSRPAWQLSLIIQFLAMPAVLGLTAVQEFVTRGGGTPVPYDPPRRLVSSGIYAYVGNPMQVSAVLLLILLGLILWNPWVAAAGVMAHVYSAGLAGWDEDEDLRRRFGEDWTTYRKGVRRWLPRWRPWRRPDRAPSRLFVSESCHMCSEVARWFDERGARGLAIVPAETHPSGALRRITYEPGDGSRAASGVEAIARALEHIHLGWALVGFCLRLPAVGWLAQLLADASGAGPRRIPRRVGPAESRPEL